MYVCSVYLRPESPPPFSWMTRHAHKGGQLSRGSGGRLQPLKRGGGPTLVHIICINVDPSPQRSHGIPGGRGREPCNSIYHSGNYRKGNDQSVNGSNVPRAVFMRNENCIQMAKMITLMK
jgi:hypothetical protein